MKQTTVLRIALITSLPLLTASVLAQQKKREAQVTLPVREVTVFKNGDVFLLHAGEIATDANGDVQLDYLPAPILGTFWPYASDSNATLISATASHFPRQVEYPAQTVSELLQANPGAEVIIVQTDGHRYEAKVVSTPLPDPGPKESGWGDGNNSYNYSNNNYNSRSSFRNTPQPPAIVLLKTKEGETAVPLNLISTVTFKGTYKHASTRLELRDHLALKLKWSTARPAKTAQVGMVYLQQGIRWIPEYRVALDGKGKAVVNLQATLINEITDLQDVTCHLVVGVPNFWFSSLPDPISLQQTFPALTNFFPPDSQTGYAFSNSIMGQTSNRGESFPARGYDGGSHQSNTPALPVSTDRSEDLFLMTVPHITLKKGENMALPVTQFSLDYEDVYRLEIPFSPPEQIPLDRSQADKEAIRLMRTPRVQHRIRFVNKSNYPFTTAPALITSNGQVVAQSQISYTSVGATVELALTTAGSVGVKQDEREVNRTKNIEVLFWNHKWNTTRLDRSGTVTVTNFDTRPAALEIVQYEPGEIDSVSHEGQVQPITHLDSDSADAVPGESRPYWWGWYNWPYWWEEVNHLNRITWKTTVAPGKSIDFTYTWHYFDASF